MIFKKKKIYDAPIIVGPWFMELGFELLYWIPFVTKIVEVNKTTKNRVLAISRGGMSEFYSHLASEYSDIFNFISVEEYKNLKANIVSEVGGQKHMKYTKIEQRLIKKTLGLEYSEIIHPSQMYSNFKPYWRRKVSADFIYDHSSYTHLNRIQTNSSGKIVVRLYRSSSFNLDQKQIVALISALGQKHQKPIVNLYSSREYDDHENLFIDSEDVENIDFSVNHSENLKLQFDVIRNCDLFVTNYGGVSYFGLYANVPTIALHTGYSKFLPIHMDISNRMDRYINTGHFFSLNKGKQEASFSQKFQILDAEFFKKYYLSLD
jgi:ADP-heptose:LPS heptosyltransferase